MLDGDSALFQAEANGLGTLYEQITSCAYFISNSISPAWADVLLRLLTKEEHRLGCTGPSGKGSSGAEILLYIAANIQNSDKV